jgi:hypothetical protein
MLNVNIVFILKSQYSHFPIFNRAQETRSWKLLQVAVLKYRVHARLKIQSSMTEIFNLLCLVRTMLQPALATDRFLYKYYIQKLECDDFNTDYETATRAIRDKLLQSSTRK